MTSISQLPNEILINILNRLDPLELRLAREVSSHWKALIDEAIGLEINLGVPNEYTSVPTTQTTLWEEVETIEHLGVQTCLIGTLDDVHGPPFKHPKVVRTINFEGPIKPFNFLTLTAPLPALQNLTLHFSALETIRLEKGILNSSRLKTFKISSYGIFPNRIRKGAERVLKNSIFLLNSIHSKQLHTCLVDLPFLPEYEKDVTVSIFKLIGCHNETLRNLQFYSGTTFQIPEGLMMAPASKTFTSKDQSLLKYGLTARTKLTRLSLALPLQTTLAHLWMTFVGNQKNLKEMFFMSDSNGVDMGVQCIRINCATLTKLLFHVNGMDDSKRRVELNCTLFSCCVNLTHFLLRGRPMVNRNGPFQIVHPKLTKTSGLPKKITLVSLREIELESDEVEALVLALPVLKKLRLVDTGSKGPCGMNVITLWNLLTSQSITELEIVRSFKEDEFQNNPFPNIFVRFLVSEVSQWWTLHVVWSEEDEAFVEKSEEMFVYRIPDPQLRANDVCDEVFK